ncbi:sensor histidine kinase [Undibacterium seohonense]|uniref:Sensor histidine kinase n=1 Tax=Undibacterium seohonense TaxID=1344950 RepID=A0ABR6X4C8_9BURK|nr:sensor histidine kinase [Undibacterium seohonense]MBC3807641.1 sensor histidine kinase [Undibacterium seohonense]
MKTFLKIFLVSGLYAGLLYAVYRLNNSDLMMVFITLSLMIPIVFLIFDKFKQAQVIDHLHQETLKAELNLLKSQINPHFFFNTLNNLYGLAVAKSDLAPEVIHKLAQMMRFTIYDGRKDSVSVAEEIAYLENFIELNQIRQQHQIDIRFNKNIADPLQRIPPLLFINLLENAFKHGVETLSSQAFIDFTLSTDSESITFTIENNFDIQVLEKNKRQRGKGGLGTENVQRRLALLFPNKHQYQSHQDGDRYRAQVNIDLT